jgi:hypothetical protein
VVFQKGGRNPVILGRASQKDKDLVIGWISGTIHTAKGSPETGGHEKDGVWLSDEL